MIRRALLVAVVSFAAALVALGCGGGKAKAKVSTPQDTKPASKPFEAPQIGASEGAASGSIALSEEDEKLIIPGAEFGKAPAVQQPTKKKKGKKGQDVGAPVVPFSEGIADQMEGLMWGMSVKKVMALFENKVKEGFAEELKAAAGDGLAEDAVRTKLLRELSKLRKSYVEFEGQRTGFEAHMIASEFTHNNKESMITWDAGKYVEYLFFINGRFWKRLRTFRVDSFQADITFLDFLASIEGRFGVKGQEFFNDKGDLDRIMWRDEETYAAAIDGSAFFGVYALRFTAAVTETYIAKLRTNKGRDTGAVGEDISSMVDAVTTSDGALRDHEASVVDSYTGAAHGSPADSQMDTTHSVTSQHKKKKGGEEAPAEPKPAAESTKGTTSDIDDLF